jgi:hypothetical protein
MVQVALGALPLDRLLIGFPVRPGKRQHLNGHSRLGTYVSPEETKLGRSHRMEVGTEVWICFGHGLQMRQQIFRQSPADGAFTARRTKRDVVALEVSRPQVTTDARFDTGAVRAFDNSNPFGFHGCRDVQECLDVCVGGLVSDEVSHAAFFIC